MKELLAAIKAELQNGLTDVRDRDIFITEDEAVVPQAVKFPCVGLKDGPIERRKYPGGQGEIKLAVRLVIWVQLQKDEASIMGDAATGKKGVLDIAEDIHTALDANLLNISGMQEAFSPAETESELIGDEETVLQRKIVTYEYIQEI